MRRRIFLKTIAWGGAALLSPLPSWAGASAGSSESRRRLIVVMLRGAVDGLSVVVPHDDPNYYAARSTIAIPKPGQEKGALDLDGRFGLHPALSALLPLWRARRLAFIHAAGSPDPTRSHFDAQDYMETGTPGIKTTADGWMNRLLGQLGPEPGEVNAVSLGPVLPRIFAGPNDVANVPLGRDAGKSTAMDKPEIHQSFDRMYAHAGQLGNVYRAGRSSRERILADLNGDPISPEMPQADNGAPQPQGFALDASQLATLMRRNPELQLGFLQLGGWDTHINQGGSDGQLANRLRPLAEGLTTLVTQLDQEIDDTLIAVMSEFGRTVRQNGTNGTDHGHGNVMWLIGAGVNGGKVHGTWPGLDESALYERRDLAVTTDFRSVLLAICERHLGLKDRHLSAVFPHGSAVHPTSGILRS